MARQEGLARVEVGDMLPLALTLVVTGIGIAFGLNIMSETKTDMCGSGYTYNSSADDCYLDSNTSVKDNPAALNATKDAISGVAKFADKMGIIATVVVAAVVIGLLVRFLMIR